MILSIDKMEDIPKDLFSSILSYLPNDSIATLRTNITLNNIIKETIKTNIFWKERVETLFERYLSNIFINWKQVYDNLVEDFEGDISFDKENNALTKASKNGHLEVVKLLLADNRIDPTADIVEAIRFSVWNNHADILALLLKDGREDPSKNFSYSIVLASEKNYHEIIKLLLNDGRADPSEYTNKSIKVASKNGYLKIMRLLLTDGRADPSANNNYTIKVASENGYLEIVKLLLADKRVDPSFENNYAIKITSKMGRLEIVKLLLDDDRVDPTANNKALTDASINGRHRVVALLLADHRIDPSIDNNQAIKLASINNRPKVVNLLLSSDKINLQEKQSALKILNSPDLNYKVFENLAKAPLKELIRLGNDNLNTRNLIMNKYLWWLRLETLYNIVNVKGNPFKIALAQET